MSKEKHEALRRDIEDYKLLLIKYQSLRVEQEILISDLERQSKFLNSKNESLVKAREGIEQLENEVNSLRIIIEKLSTKISELEKNYKNAYRLYYIEKGKVYHMKKGQARLRAWQGITIFFFLAMLIVGSQ